MVDYKNLTVINRPIEYFNRYTQRIETEEVYGSYWLRLAYGGTRLGSFGLWTMAKRAWFSRWYGWKMSQVSSAKKIASFAKKYGVDTECMAETLESFDTFNAFFYRTLKEGARPINRNPDTVVFPADGRHLGFQNVDAIDGIFVKGQRFNLEQLLGSQELAAKYRGGALVLSRLCPVDYHRFHFPVSGVPEDATLINGPLYSVSPIALRQKISILMENKRMLTSVASDRWGDVLCIEIGATCVGTIQQTYTPGILVEKGAEKGYFSFGGSSTITLFEPGKIRLAEDLVRHAEEGRELYAHMGDAMGQGCSA